MREKMISIRARAAALALAAAMGAMMSAAPARAQQADVALVYRLLQESRMLVNPATAPRVAQLGDRLRNGDEVFTSANTRAALRFTDDGSILRLNPSARLRLTSGDERGVVVRTLQMEFGEVWVRVARHQGTTLRVQTPAGVAAVKGTEFVVRVDSATRATTVITLEGVVEFFNPSGRVDLPAGRKVTVASGGQAPRAEAATPQDVRGAEGVRGDEPGGEPGEWIQVQLQNASGQTRTLMLRVPAGALREREGRP